MRNACSVDLRVRVVTAVDDGMTHKEAADVFKVGVASVYRWLRLRRETGDLRPRPVGGGNPRAIGPEDEVVLRGLVEERPDRTLEELTRLLEERGVTASSSSVCRALQRMGLTLKKSASRQGSANAQMCWRSDVPTSRR